MSVASRDQNDVPTLLGVSSSDGTTPITVYADPTTHRLLVDSASGSGTVTSVSVVTANGFAGTVATATTTPAITLTTTVTGILKGDGTAISAATAGTDYTALAFKTIVVAGQSDIVADSAADTLTIVAGAGITLTTNAGTDTLTITSSSGAVGAPVNSIQYNNASAFAGSSHLLYDGTNTIDFGAENSNGTLEGVDATSTDSDGGGIVIRGGQGDGAGDGGNVEIIGRDAPTTGNGGQITLTSGAGGATSGSGGNITISASGATAGGGNGGNVLIGAGQKNGAGTVGTVQVVDPVSGFSAILNTASLASTNKTFTFPNSSGTFALTSGGSLALVVGTTTIGSGTTTRILYDNAGTLGEYTLTGSGTVVAMQTAPTFVTSITTPSVLATSNDSGALGASGTAFSDLFLASGAVINFAAGNVTLTHSSGILTQNAGELRITSANVGTNADSVPTLSSTSTFTNKTLTSPTIQTSPVLAAATNLKFTVPSSDVTGTGITTNEFNSGYSSTAIGDLVYLDSSSTWQKADADASAATYSSLLGIALSVTASASPATVLLQGFVYAASPFPTFTIGAPIYMSATAGAVTQTAPVTTDSATRIVGYAVHADKMWFNPSNDWITHT